MERLSFNEASRYDGLEAAIHVARYLLASTHCKGKRVLDIACGEGYGSRLLKNWGAAEVVGVDVSQEAVEHARRHFGGDGVTYHCAAAEQLPQLLAGQRFDLIVSLETIEHLRQPELFLADLRQALNPGGCIIISCPNDWWYFPKAEESNPYHVRKYHFEEFRQQTESTLGPASSWLFGAPTFGFLNTIRGSCISAADGAGQLDMIQGRSLELARLLPAEFGAAPAEHNASYFVGVWGGDTAAPAGTAALLPLSMDAFNQGIFQGHFSAKQEQLRQSGEALAAQCAELQRQLDEAQGQREQWLGEQRKAGLLQQAALNENRLMQDTIEQLKVRERHQRGADMQWENETRKLGLLRQAALAENRCMHDTIRQLKHTIVELELGQHSRETQLQMQLEALERQVAFLRVGHERYVRLSGLLPSGLRRVAMALKTLLRKGK